MRKHSHINCDSPRERLISVFFIPLFSNNDRRHLTHDVTVLTMYGVKYQSSTNISTLTHGQYKVSPPPHPADFQILYN